jgi:hypothetical protein
LASIPGLHKGLKIPALSFTPLPFQLHLYDHGLYNYIDTKAFFLLPFKKSPKAVFRTISLPFAGRTLSAIF